MQFERDRIQDSFCLHRIIMQTLPLQKPEVGIFNHVAKYKFLEVLETNMNSQTVFYLGWIQVYKAQGPDSTHFTRQKKKQINGKNYSLFIVGKLALLRPSVVLNKTEYLQ